MNAPTDSLPPDQHNTSMDVLEIQPIDRFCCRIRPPGSKSLTNRALVISALADGRSELINTLDSEDTQVMIESWKRLGVPVEQRKEDGRVLLLGCGGQLPAPSADLFLANSGTSMRFLAAAAALGHGVFRLDGVARMRERPIEGLLAALRDLGADAESEWRTGCPPVLIRASGLRGGMVRISGEESSQYVSALLMAAPYANREVHIEILGELVSEPFVQMTVRVMEDFGVVVQRSEPHNYLVPAGQCYRARTYEIEPDATAASYFWAAAAITGGEVTIEGLGQSSVQGDVSFVDLLEQMGAQVTRREKSITVSGRASRGIRADMNAISDTALTLAVVAAFADGPTTIHNIAHIRRQETDRIHAVATELNRIGAHVSEHSDGLSIVPAPLHGARIETYNDHRMAMSFALVGLRVSGILISNPACTGKTYPRFFSDLRRLSAESLTTVLDATYDSAPRSHG